MRKFIFVIFVLLFTLSALPGLSASNRSAQQSNARTTDLKQQAPNICSKTPADVIIKMEKPQIKYITNLSPKQFVTKYRESECTQMDGELFCVQALTVPPPMFVSLNVKVQSRQRRNKVYVCPDKLILTVKFKDPILVYITNQVQPNSCRYNVFYNHENYHVAVFNQSVDFFKPQIKQFFQNELKKLPPYQISSPGELMKAAQQINSTLMTNFKPVQDYINKKINEKNEAIDTADAYRAQSALCDGKE